jgi:hypothetical protein
MVVGSVPHARGHRHGAWRRYSATRSTRQLKLPLFATAGLGEQVHTLALRAYDQMIGVERDDVAVDGCVTNAPSGGEVAGRSPVDRGNQGLKRSIATDGQGIPLHPVSAGATRHDAPLLRPALAGLEKLDRLPDRPTTHLDRGYDGRPSRALLDDLGFDGAIARKGVPAPIQAGSRRVVERTHQWMSGYGQLRRCTEKRHSVVDFYPFLAAALVVIRQLIQHARLRYRWPARPTTGRLK